MVDRAALRTALRLRLVDTTGDPLWPDATLNDAIAEAVTAYGLRVPRPATLEMAVGAGATAVPVAGVGADPTGLLRLIDPWGRVVPLAATDPAGGGAAQTWRWWDGTVRFARPALGGTWRLEYLAPRLAPTTDTEPLAIEMGDDPIVLTLAMAAALRGRALDDAKRGARSQIRALADAARAEAAALFVARHRRVRSGYFTPEY